MALLLKADEHSFRIQFICVYTVHFIYRVPWFKRKSCEHFTIIFSDIALRVPQSLSPFPITEVKAMDYGEMCWSFMCKKHISSVEMTMASIFIWLTSSFHWLISFITFNFEWSICAQKKKKQQQHTATIFLNELNRFV